MMEVRVLTRRKGKYIFTEENGKWMLFRHQRSYYMLTSAVKIRKFHPLKFVGRRYYTLTNQCGAYVNIHSSLVMKILVDGVPVKKITINQ